MTKEIREYAKCRIEYLLKICRLDERDKEALEMAIQALSQEPTNEKELNKAYTFGHNRGVKAYYNEQLCTVELPEAVFRYILSLVPTEEAEQEPCDDAISREAVLEAVSEGCQELRGVYGRCEELINALPSVTQSITRDIEKSNFSQEQYLLDTDSAYQIGYEQGHKDAEQKSGKWIETEYHRWRCSVCREKGMSEWDNIHDVRTNFCPDCGADMRGAE